MRSEKAMPPENTPKPRAAIGLSALVSTTAAESIAKNDESRDAHKHHGQLLGHTAMVIDPGPDIPPTCAQRGVGSITRQQAIDVRGHEYRRRRSRAPYTRTTTRVASFRAVPFPPVGYSEPWWRTAVATGAEVSNARRSST